MRAAESNARRHLYRTALRRQTERNCGSCCSGAEQQRLTHGGLVERQDGATAYSPVWDWSDDDVWTCLARHQLRLNPVYDKLRRLGAPEVGAACHLDHRRRADQARPDRLVAPRLASDLRRAGASPTPDQ